MAAPRLRYEALVELGAEEVGGFEAESVDVSLDGMRMRTAYLPEVGATLRCRFDGFGGEIVAEGEVVWCQQEGRGGEFGIRFVGLDAHALTLLGDLCTPEGEGDEAEGDEPSTPSAALVGTRVRLHIEGLGSPMRARVRDAADGEVLIGSNLEFLKVGRGVELEDVDHNKRRIAHIEHVSVDIDPDSNVPQLVVALSYEAPSALGRRDVGDELDAIEQEELTTAPYRARVAREVRGARAHQIEAESTPEPTVIDTEHPSAVAMNDADAKLDPASSRRERVAKVPPASVAASDIAADGDEDEDDDDLEPAVKLGASRAAARRATETVGAFARKLGPTLASASAGAKGVFGSILTTVKQRQLVRREEKARARAPKRTTAPPPSVQRRAAAALRGKRPTGARKLREQHVKGTDAAPEVEAVETSTPEPSGRRRAVASAAFAAVAVVGIYFASGQVRSLVGKSPDEVVATAPTAADAAGAAPELPNFPTQPEGVATANVPLFGATPLSTTETVPAPPDGVDGAGDGAAAGDEAGSPEAPAKASGFGNLDKEWGVGEVEDPTVLRLSMDGKIEGITGNETATGFTVVVPGRKSVSSAAGLARKDKRLESVSVVNYPDRAEVTVHFKKEVPAFMVRAQGKRLVVEIATAKKQAAPAPKKKKK